jgi:aminoglycoside phosphotransferase (APT) family kinase protein
MRIDVSLVDGLVRGQFPRWHGLALTELKHGGTDHAIYRLGDERAVRLHDRRRRPAYRRNRLGLRCRRRSGR